MPCDAIVNPTNSEMFGTAGVDGKIHQICGDELDEECAKLAPLGLGCAKITGAYNLPAKYIIHTSGPVWQNGYLGESIILKSCYIECLKLAQQYDCETVAFPLISSGTYGYPKDQVLKQAVATIAEYLVNNEMTVYLCVFDKTAYEFSKELYKNIKDYIDGDEEMPLLGTLRCKRVKPFFDEELLDDEDTHLACEAPEYSARGMSLGEYLKHMDKPFMKTLYDYIDQKDMTDVECYKRANVDKKTFSIVKT